MVDQRGGVVGEQGVGPADQSEVVAQVAAGFFGCHGWHGVAQPDALVERREHAEFHSPSESGLADQQAGEGAGVVHAVVGEHADGLQLRVIK